MESRALGYNKNVKLLRRAVAGIISFSILGVLPGQDCYLACARVVEKAPVSSAPRPTAVSLSGGLEVSPDFSIQGPAGAPASPDAPAQNVPAPAAVQGQPADIVVVFKGAVVSQDIHLSLINVRARNGVGLYAQAEQALLGQMNQAGLDAQTLAAHQAAPVASYRRINAATLRVDSERADDFIALLRARGHAVFSNERRKIITPVPLNPETVDPQARGAVSMPETLRITKTEKVHKTAEGRWGPPDLGRASSLVLRLAGAAAPQPPVAVIDSGAETTHPLIRRVKKVVNLTNGKNEDDIGHGTWVTSMVLNFAQWLKNLTHYKAFVGGSASLDDILKALTAAANDGNIVISNSWGSDDGDPESPDSLLVRKLAEEGHIMVFAAGNEGPGGNTIGSPAIVYYKEARTGALRVISVAATDRDKKVASFSSRGPGSGKTKKKPGYPFRPDLSSVGHYKEGAWPKALGGDRNDPVFGPLRAISGTSMSTPDVAGAIALLCMLLGVTTRGEKLDAIVNALMATLEKTGQQPVAEGQGFLNVEAAYAALAETFKPLAPGFAARLALRALGRSRSS